MPLKTTQSQLVANTVKLRNKARRDVLLNKIETYVEKKNPVSEKDTRSRKAINMFYRIREYMKICCTLVGFDLRKYKNEMKSIIHFLQNFNGRKDRYAEMLKVKGFSPHLCQHLVGMFIEYVCIVSLVKTLKLEITTPVVLLQDFLKTPVDYLDEIADHSMQVGEKVLNIILEEGDSGDKRFTDLVLTYMLCRDIQTTLNILIEDLSSESYLSGGLKDQVLSLKEKVRTEVKSLPDYKKSIEINKFTFNKLDSYDYVLKYVSEVTGMDDDKQDKIYIICTANNNIYNHVLNVTKSEAIAKTIQNFYIHYSVVSLIESDFKGEIQFVQDAFLKVKQTSKFINQILKYSENYKYMVWKVKSMGSYNIILGNYLVALFNTLAACLKILEESGFDV